MGEPPPSEPPPLSESETTQPSSSTSSSSSSQNSNSSETNENVNQNQMSANEHGQKMRNFYFEGYRSRKLQSRDKHLEFLEKESNRLAFHFKFENCCKLVVDKNSKVNSKTVFEAIKNSTNAEEYAKIVSIYAFKSQNVWIIELKDANSHLEFINKCIKVNETIYTLIDANVRAHTINLEPKIFTLTAILRIHWLPASLNSYEIQKFLEEKCKIRSLEVVKEYIGESFKPYIINEKSLHDKNINNGVFRVKVKYDVDVHDHLLDLMGIVDIGGLRALIELVGQPPKCLFCKNFGHYRKDCGKKKLKCSKCNKIGHEASGCNAASRFFSSESNENEEYVGMENEMDTNDNQASGEVNQNSGEANQASGEANQASGESNQASGEANQASGEANQASGEANQASGVANQASGEAEQATGGADRVSDEANGAPHVENSFFENSNQAENSDINKENEEIMSLEIKKEKISKLKNTSVSSEPKSSQSNSSASVSAKPEKPLKQNKPKVLSKAEVRRMAAEQKILDQAEKIKADKKERARLAEEELKRTNAHALDASLKRRRQSDGVSYGKDGKEIPGGFASKSRTELVSDWDQ